MNASTGGVHVVPWPGWRELLGSPAEAARDFSVAAFLAAWVAVIGPFDNDQAGPIELRLLYHVSLSVAVVLAYRPGVRLGIAAGARIGAGRVLSAIVSIVLISLPMSVLVSTVAGWFFPHLREILSPVDWYLQLVVLMLPIALAYQVFTGVLALQRRVRPDRTPGAVAVSELDSKAEAARLPINPGDVLAVHVEDHYLRLYTSTGSRLVYMTMSDALALLSGADGLQVHRSWWVARRAVGRVVRRGRGAHLHLTCDAVAPVARARIADLKAARWL